MNVGRNNKDYEVFVAARLWGQLCSPNKIMVTIKYYRNESIHRVAMV
jgi:hypothetical protein